ncbi:MAG: N-acetylmuramoyl-L-alanine amidase [Muribaculaceae bacterium]|nr:N-acetylmuramoyl-L-alanine amidase [Muribaculaceae bacterium]
MRKINEIIIHCSATPAGREVTVEEMRRWHRARGFRDVGYHYIIALDGTVLAGRPVAVAGAHCLGHNAHSIGICYVGGLDADGHPADTRTTEQRTALRKIVRELMNRHHIANVHGHNEFAQKSCPCFDVRKEKF